MAARKKKAPGTHVGGASLVPDVDVTRRPIGVESEYLYWVGLIASCPVDFVDIAGINFPKANEDLVPDRMRPGKLQRVPKFGTIVPLTQRKMKMLVERLPRTVLRIYEDVDQTGAQEEPGTGKNVGKDPHVRPRRGQLITIPSPDEIEAFKKNARSFTTYRPQPIDRPIADFLYAQLCEDQEEGNRGERFPDVLSETGLVWPEEIEDLSALL